MYVCMYVCISVAILARGFGPSVGPLFRLAPRRANHNCQRAFRPATSFRRNRPGTAAPVARARPTEFYLPLSCPLPRHGSPWRRRWWRWRPRLRQLAAAAMVLARATLALAAPALRHLLAATPAAPTGSARLLAALAKTAALGGHGTLSSPGLASCAGRLPRRMSLPSLPASVTWKVLLPFRTTPSPTVPRLPAAAASVTSGTEDCRLRVLPRLPATLPVGCPCPLLQETCQGPT